MDQRLWSSLSISASPLSNGRGASRRLWLSLSFALSVLSLYSSYANRLLTFVKTKRRDGGQR